MMSVRSVVLINALAPVSRVALHIGGAAQVQDLMAPLAADRTLPRDGTGIECKMQTGAR